VKKATLLGLLVPIALMAVLVAQHYSPARRGERAFAQLGCTGCHFSGAGPNLTHAVRKHDPAFLEQFLLDPMAVYGRRNGEPLNHGYMRMPKMNATPDDVRNILAYLAELDKSSDQ
jgi:cytochrome c2